MEGDVMTARKILGLAILSSPFIAIAYIGAVVADKPLETLIAFGIAGGMVALLWVGVELFLG